MRRINLIVSEALRDLLARYSMLHADGVLARGSAEAIGLGCRAYLDMMGRDPERAARLIAAAKAAYPLLKSGRSPKIVVYLDIIDARVLREALIATGLHPKTRAYRIFLAIGLSESVELTGQDAMEDQPLLLALKSIRADR